MTAGSGMLEKLLRRDRQIVTVALAAVIAAAWIYTVSGAGMGMSAFEMSRLGIQADPQPGQMPMGEPVSVFVLMAMWWVMMIAMMLPSATPVVLLAAALNRRSHSAQPPYGSTLCFVLGYLLAWLFFSGLAAASQLLLQSNGLLSPMMQSNSNGLTAALLLAAGVWQFSPIKQACLRHCRSPVTFITQHRRPGNSGALVMGLHHGSYCLGCCWFLMALLFVGGVMNLYWIAGLALFVLLEKLFAGGVWFGRVAGAGLVLSGTALLVL